MSKKSMDKLKYSQQKVSQSTVKRQYKKWRQDQLIATRCDNPECVFHAQPLEWNRKTLPLILDHINGNRSDNRPDNLRYLCPNCDAQLTTRGGSNKGRVSERREEGFTLISKEGKREITEFLSVSSRSSCEVDISILKVNGTRHSVS